MNEHGRILLNPWIDRSKKKLAWTRKHTVGGFAALRDKLKSHSNEARQMQEKLKKGKIEKLSPA